MASIRRFFEKKKMDRKFKQAGRGHTLAAEPSQAQSSQAPTSTSAQQPSQQIQRQRSSESARAGDAALKRYEMNKIDTSRPVSSKASWKHSTIMSPELSKEQIKAELGLADIPEKQKELNLEASPALAVSGIYFQCPLCPVCLSETEIMEHLESCLMKDINQEPAMTTPLMIHTLNAKKPGVDGCITILKKYLENIIKNPGEEKYRKIKKSNKVFKDKVAPFRGVSQFLTLGCGFVEEDIQMPETETTESFYVLPEDLAKDEEKLKLMIEFLEEAEPLKPTLDRGARVFGPSSAPSRIELPRSFYELSSSEIKREQQAMTDAVEKGKQLRTKAMREMEGAQNVRRYRFSVLRIRFPDGYLIQGTKEKPEDRSKTISSLGLAPAALLNFVPDPSLGDGGGNGFLLPDLMARIESL